MSWFDQCTPDGTLCEPFIRCGFKNRVTEQIELLKGLDGKMFRNLSARVGCGFGNVISVTREVYRNAPSPTKWACHRLHARRRLGEKRK